jgi:Na+/melibiose symporter-like transporter
MIRIQVASFLSCKNKETLKKRRSEGFCIMGVETNDGQQSKLMARFLVIFAGQAFSLFGSRLVQFSLVWWLTATSGSASTLAFASIMALLPQVLLGPFAGTLVDRWNRRRVMIVADGLLALVIVALGLLYAWGGVQIWHVFIAMFLRSLLGAFHWPAMQTATTMMVPEEHLSRVAGLNQSLQGLSNIVAPPPRGDPARTPPDTGDPVHRRGHRRTRDRAAPLRFRASASNTR